MLLAPTLPEQPLLYYIIIFLTFPPGLSHGDISDSLRRDTTVASEKFLSKKYPRSKMFEAKIPPPPRKQPLLETVFPGLNYFGESVRQQVPEKKRVINRKKEKRR